MEQLYAERGITSGRAKAKLLREAADQAVGLIPLPSGDVRREPLSSDLLLRFVALAHGQWHAVALQCPAAIPLFVVAAALLVWHAAGLLTGRIIMPGPGLRIRPRSWALLLMGGGAILLANWIYRLAAGLQ